MEVIILIFSFLLFDHEIVDGLRLTKSSFRAGVRKKRLVDGYPLLSHDSFGTESFVSIRSSFGCPVTDVHSGTGLFHHCPMRSACGGSIIAPKFVLTACQCMRWWKYRMAPHNVQPSPDERELDYERFYFPPDDRVKRGLHSGPFIVPLGRPLYFGRPRPYHPMYNRMIIIAGKPMKIGVRSSMDATKDVQARHSTSFFPHEKCCFMQHSDFRRGYLYSDYGLIRVCEDFSYVPSAVRPATLPHAVVQEEFYSDRLRRRFFCLVISYNSKETLFRSDELSYVYKMMRTGYSECLGNTKNDCSFGLVNFGIHVSALSPNDAGVPVICDRHLTGLVSSTSYSAEYLNGSIAVAFTTACLGDSLTENHLAILEKLANQSADVIDSWPYGSVPYNTTWLEFDQWARWKGWFENVEKSWMEDYYVWRKIYDRREGYESWNINEKVEFEGMQRLYNYVKTVYENKHKEWVYPSRRRRRAASPSSAKLELFPFNAAFLVAVALIPMLSVLKSTSCLLFISIISYVNR